MSAEEGYLVRDTATLVDGDDDEGAAAAGFPVDRDVFWIGLKRMSRQLRRWRLR